MTDTPAPFPPSSALADAGASCAADPSPPTPDEFAQGDVVVVAPRSASGDPCLGRVSRVDPDDFTLRYLVDTAHGPLWVGGARLRLASADEALLWQAAHDPGLAEPVRALLAALRETDGDIGRTLRPRADLGGVLLEAAERIRAYAGVRREDRAALDRLSGEVARLGVACRCWVLAAGLSEHVAREVAGMSAEQALAWCRARALRGPARQGAPGHTDLMVAPEAIGDLPDTTPSCDDGEPARGDAVRVPDPPGALAFEAGEEVYLRATGEVLGRVVARIESRYLWVESAQEVGEVGEYEAADVERVRPADALPRVVAWSALRPGDLAFDAGADAGTCALLLVRESGRGQWRDDRNGRPISSGCSSSCARGVCPRTSKSSGPSSSARSSRFALRSNYREPCHDLGRKKTAGPA